MRVRIARVSLLGGSLIPVLSQVILGLSFGGRLYPFLIRSKTFLLRWARLKMACVQI